MKTSIFFLFLLAGASASATPAAKPGTPMCVTVCGVSHTDPNIDEKLARLREMGVTSIQTYIYWNKVEKTPGVYDWSDYDADVALFQKHGLKWVPFVITGPWYVTPGFVRQDPRIPCLRCLEHDRPSAIPSIWSEPFRGQVRGYLAKFAAHYQPMGVLESVNLGITGDYGEAIYSVIGNWPGEYHSHQGFWCGDALAVADFRASLRRRYPGGIASLNAAWRSHYGSFDDLRPFGPAQAPSERAWQEFLAWYRGAMTAYADFCLATARGLFPGTDLYLCTGGDMAPEHGSDFSAQAKVAAAHGAGLRITNEASSFPANVRYTRLVDSAGRFYGAYVGHEPAATVTPTGMVGRIFNAVTSGARQLFVYYDGELVAESDGHAVLGVTGKSLQRYHDWLRTTAPQVETAIYCPLPSSADTLTDRQHYTDLVSQLRGFIDYDLVDDSLIADGILTGKKILIVAGVRIVAAETTARLRQWVEAGGVLLVLDSRGADWDGQTAAFDALDGLTPQSDEITGITELKVDAPGVLPSIAGLTSVFVTRAYTSLQRERTPLLSMNYTDRGRVAWRVRLGRGWVYTYFGPMDLKPEDQSWMVARQIPLRFIEDALRAGAADGTLGAVPATLNRTVPDVFLVQTDTGLWRLNLGTQDRLMEEKGRTLTVPAGSIVRP